MTYDSDMIHSVVIVYQAFHDRGCVNGNKEQDAAEQELRLIGKLGPLSNTVQDKGLDGERKAYIRPAERVAIGQIRFLP